MIKLLSDIKGLFSKPEKRSFTDSYQQKWSFGNRSLYTIDIQNPTVSAAISLIANSISKLPLNLYFRKNDDSRIKAPFHPLFNVIKYRPNSEETPITFKYRLVKYLLVNGNAYIFKSKDSNGVIQELFFMNPSRVTVRLDSFGHKTFSYDGTIYTADDVLHIPALDYDGLIGHSPLEAAKYAVELGNTLDNFAQNSIKNGFNSQLWIDTTNSIDSKQDAIDITTDINSRNSYYSNHYTGADNAGKTIVGLPGDKAEKIDLSSNRDAQLQESREFQVKEICKLFNIPVGLLTGEEVSSGIEKINQLFLSNALAPWLELIQQYFNKFLSDFESERYYFEFDTTSIVTMTLQDKYSAYDTAIKAGIYSVNDVLTILNMPGLDEQTAGNIHFYPNSSLPLTDANIEATLAQSKLALQKMDTTHNTTGYGDAGL